MAASQELELVETSPGPSDSDCPQMSALVCLEVIIDMITFLC